MLVDYWATHSTGICVTCRKGKDKKDMDQIGHTTLTHDESRKVRRKSGTLNGGWNVARVLKPLWRCHLCREFLINFPAKCFVTTT